MLEFAWPWAALFLPLPVLIYFTTPRLLLRYHGELLRVPFVQSMRQIHDGESQFGRMRWYCRILAIMVWIGLIAATLRPQWVGDALELPVSGRDLMLAVDLSGSMEVEDFQREYRVINRLEAIKWVAGSFIERRVGDRLGLILFGSNAYLQTPLTFDRKTVHTLLLESAIGLAGDATAIGDAIGLALKRIGAARKDGDEINPVLILLTDGANTAGEVEPLEAAKLAAEKGLKIYTIGIGADEIVVRSLFGNRRINPSADLDEELLKEVAEITGGLYFRARDSEEFQAIYKLLDELEPVVRESMTFRPHKDLYYWPLGTSLFLGVILLWLMQRRTLNG